MQVAPQDPEPYITLISTLAPITTTLHTVARLQRTDCRFHSRMPTPRLPKFHTRSLVLLSTLMSSLRRQARMLDNLCQLLLVFRRVKAPIKRRTFDFAAAAIL